MEEKKVRHDDTMIQVVRAIPFYMWITGLVGLVAHGAIVWHEMESQNKLLAEHSQILMQVRDSLASLSLADAKRDFRIDELERRLAKAGIP